MTVPVTPDTFAPRLYPAIVQDLLTTLTGGTVREGIVAPAGDVTQPLALLAKRPVQRVSHLEGVVTVGTGPQATEAPYVFTSADFELVSSTGDPTALDRIQFRPKGRRPVPGSTLTVNYYPITTPPVPLTDLNVGSVTRTLLETVALELALTYQQLQRVYRSAFLATAEGDSLDKVVALAGVLRLPANLPIATVRFTRRPDVPGRLAIPAGTAVTDAKGSRYLTTVELILEGGETSREVTAAGESPATPVVDAGALDRLETAVVGVSHVTNASPAHAPAAAESDDDLRRRAAGGFHAAVRGTLDSLTTAILSVPGVKDVKATEPPEVPGVVRLSVAYGDPSAAVKAAVQVAVDKFRPAGIRVVTGESPRIAVAVSIALTLKASAAAGLNLAGLDAQIEQRLADYLSSIPPGGSARRSQMAALALQSPEVADVAVTLSPQGGAVSPDLTLPEGSVIDAQRPFSFLAPTYEGGKAPALTSTVNAMLPVHLAPGVTADQVNGAIKTAVDAHLATRGPTAALTLDGLAAGIRDDTRFALVRGDATVSVEAGGRFLQLSDRVGSYVPAPNETLAAGEIGVDVREGGA